MAGLFCWRGTTYCNDTVDHGELDNQGAGEHIVSLFPASPTRGCGHDSATVCPARKEPILNDRRPDKWPATSKEALNAEIGKASRVNLTGRGDAPKLVAAVDTAIGWGGDRVYSVAVLMSFPELKETQKCFAVHETDFPHLRGLRYYREGPAILKAMAGLSTKPDLLILTAHGIAHPRRCGMACHIGLDLDIPAIGCARRLLAGVHHPVALDKGNQQPIMLGGRQVGVAYRSRTNVKPIYISPAHKCDLPFAIGILTTCLGKFRFPEPIRLAHRLVTRHRREMDRERISDSVYARGYKK